MAADDHKHLLYTRTSNGASSTLSSVAYRTKLSVASGQTSVKNSRLPRCTIRRRPWCSVRARFPFHPTNVSHVLSLLKGDLIQFDTCITMHLHTDLLIIILLSSTEIHQYPGSSWYRTTWIPTVPDLYLYLISIDVRAYTAVTLVQMHPRVPRYPHTQILDLRGMGP